MQSPDSIFRVPPFPAFPSVSRYVNLGSLADGFTRVCRSVEAREGLSLVIGPPGTGKSLLCGLLQERFQASHDVVLLGETQIDNRVEFLRHVLHHLGVQYNRVPDGDLQLALIDRVCAKDSPESGLLVIVDEAQTLVPEVLEAIRMTTNIMRRGEPRVCAVVCGGPRLDETLAIPSLEPFTQRIATRCYLHPMSVHETRQYINESIRNCGAEPSDTISTEAISAVHHACSGVPRLINQLMTQAIDCAEARGRSVIGVREIDLAWSQLQQLPSPMVDEPTFAPRSSVEFGELDEMPRSSNQSPKPNASHSTSTAPRVAASFTTSDNIADDFDEEMILNDPLPLGELSFDDFPFEDDEHAEQVIEIDTRPTQSAHDELEDSSIEWVLEPGAAKPTRYEAPSTGASIAIRTPLPSALFGDFETEEDVEIGVAAASSSLDSRDTIPHDLESMLHEEIVGMSGDMRLFQYTGEEAQTRAFDVRHQVDHIEPEVKSLPIRPAAFGDGSRECAARTRITEVESFLADDVMISGDDSDILIIEEDVNVIGKVEPPRMRREEATISIDFQSMLNRMRGGA